MRPLLVALAIILVVLALFIISGRLDEPASEEQDGATELALPEDRFEVESGARPEGDPVGNDQQSGP